MEVAVLPFISNPKTDVIYLINNYVRMEMLIKWICTARIPEYHWQSSPAFEW